MDEIDSVLRIRSEAYTVATKALEIVNELDRIAAVLGGQEPPTTSERVWIRVVRAPNNEGEA